MNWQAASGMVKTLHKGEITGGWGAHKRLHAGLWGVEQLQGDKDPWTGKMQEGPVCVPGPACSGLIPSLRIILNQVEQNPQ